MDIYYFKILVNLSLFKLFLMCLFTLLVIRIITPIPIVMEYNALDLVANGHALGNMKNWANSVRRVWKKKWMNNLNFNIR